MVRKTLVVGIMVAVLLSVAGCSREQSDWEKARGANTTDSYELFVKKYPTGKFTGQAEARLKELYEQRDYQKARDTDTPEAYQAFLRQYPDGKLTDEARIRLENFTLAQGPSEARAGAPGPASVEPPAAPAGAGAGPPAAAIPPPAPASSPPQPAASPKTAAGGAALTPAQGRVRQSSAPRSALKKEPSGYTIQLGAFKSGKTAASAHWATLEKTYPSLLKGLSPRIRTSKTTVGRLFRLQVASLSRTRAHSICKDLKAKSQPCLVLPLAAR